MVKELLDERRKQDTRLVRTLRTKQLAQVANEGVICVIRRFGLGGLVWLARQPLTNARLEK